MLTAGSDNTARLWDSATGRQRHALSPACEVFDASFSRDGKMAVTGCREGTGAVWNVADGRRLQVLSGHKDAIFRATFSPDGKAIVTASADDTARLWNVADGSTLRTLSGHDDSVLVAV